MPVIDGFQYRTEKVFGKGIYHCSLDDVEIYHQHNKHIRKVVPKERLLEFESKEGYEPLCEFLHLPIPTDEQGEKLSYPHVNDTKELRRGMNFAAAFGVLTWVAVLPATVFGLRYLWKASRSRLASD